jgi:glycyl-tRNA synthetase beta chain
LGRKSKLKMSEFFLELFSEEIPSNLQKKLRDDLLENFQKSFNEKSIEFKNSFSKSTPNRAVIVFEGLKKETIIKSEEIKGPNIKAPEKATEGFLRSNNITKKDLIIKKTDKGDFYFFKKKQQKIKTQNILKDLILENLNKIQWKKSMRWGSGELNWGRPLKSILAIYDKKKVDFKFHHIPSNNFTFLDTQFEEKTKIVKDYKDYQSSLKKIEKIVDNLKQFKQILGLKFNTVLFDNMNLNSLKAGIKLAKKYYETEASGNINLNNIKKVAATGVNRISVGSITHSVPAVDFKLQY